jgi:lipopolysaccharide export system permease protein
MIGKLTSNTLRQLTLGLLLVAGGLTTVIWLTQSLKFIDMIINNGATPVMFLKLTMLMMPSFLPITLPIALFVVVLFVYSKMTADRELVVMAAAGLSPVQLAKPVLILATMVMIFTFMNNILFLPESHRMFGELRWQIKYSFTQVMLDPGKFNVIGDKTTVYIREKTADNTLSGIFIHDESIPGAPVTVIAKSGAMVKSGNGANIIMFDGNRQVLDKETNDYSVLFFDRYTFAIDDYQEEQISRTPDRREMDLNELFTISTNDKILPRDRPKYIIEGHKRLTSPLVGIAFVLIALVCQFSGGFTRRNHTKRTVVAAVIILALQIIILGVENMSARNLTLIPAMYAITIIPIIACSIMLLKPPNIKFLN